MVQPQPGPWLDPELAAAGALLRERGLAAPPLEQAPIAASRAAYARIDGWRDLVRASGCAAINVDHGRDAGDRQDWRAVPLQAAAGGLPPAFLHACSLDPLLDDSVALQRRLQEAGARVRLVIHEGLAHGVVRHSPLVGSVRAMVADAAASLRQALGPGLAPA